MALSLLTALHNNLQMKMLLFMGCFMEGGEIAVRKAGHGVGLLLAAKRVARTKPARRFTRV